MTQVHRATTRLLVKDLRNDGSIHNSLYQWPVTPEGSKVLVHD